MHNSLWQLPPGDVLKCHTFVMVLIAVRPSGTEPTSSYIAVVGESNEDSR